MGVVTKCATASGIESGTLGSGANAGAVEGARKSERPAGGPSALPETMDPDPEEGATAGPVTTASVGATASGTGTGTWGAGADAGCRSSDDPGAGARNPQASKMIALQTCRRKAPITLSMRCAAMLMSTQNQRAIALSRVFLKYCI